MSKRLRNNNMSLTRYAPKCMVDDWLDAEMGYQLMHNRWKQMMKQYRESAKEWQEEIIGKPTISYHQDHRDYHLAQRSEQCYCLMPS